MSNPISSDRREEVLLGKLEDLVTANRQLLQELHQLSFALVDLVAAYQRVLREGACLITEKAIHQALEDFEKREKPLDHRKVSSRILGGGIVKI